MPTSGVTVSRWDIEEIEEQLQPKRAHSDADAGDAHEIHAENDNWDLRGHRREETSQSSGPDLLVSGCTSSNQTAWTEDQFTVTSSVGIRNREKRAADTVVRELKRDKPGEWACIQAHEVWSTEEEANMCPGHFWICKLGTVPGSMSCVEKKFEFQGSNFRSGTPQRVLSTRVFRWQCSSTRVSCAPRTSPSRK